MKLSTISTFFKKHAFACLVTGIIAYGLYGGLVSLVDEYTLLDRAIIISSSFTGLVLPVVMYFRPRPFLSRFWQFLVGCLYGPLLFSTVLGTIAIFTEGTILGAIGLGLGFSLLQMVFAFEWLLPFAFLLVGAFITRNKTKVNELDRDAITEVFS